MKQVITNTCRISKSGQWVMYMDSEIKWYGHINKVRCTHHLLRGTFKASATHRRHTQSLLSTKVELHCNIVIRYIECSTRQLGWCQGSAFWCELGHLLLLKSRSLLHVLVEVAVGFLRPYEKGPSASTFSSQLSHTGINKVTYIKNQDSAYQKIDLWAIILTQTLLKRHTYLVQLYCPL